MNDKSLQRPLLALALAAATLMIPGVAAAAESKLLYKCVNDKGVASIQSSKCPAGSTEAWRRPAPREAPPTPEQSAAAAAKIQRDEQTVRELSAEVEKKLQPAPTVIVSTPTAEPTPSPSSDPPTPESISISACQAAQSFATAVREKTWLGMTDDQTRRLYGWVADQCKVQTQRDD